jgi:hypothetical protein
MRWRGIKDEDDIMIRKRNVGKEMRKKRIRGCEREQFGGVDGDVVERNKMECWAENTYWFI